MMTVNNVAEQQDRCTCKMQDFFNPPNHALAESKTLLTHDKHALTKSKTLLIHTKPASAKSKILLTHKNACPSKSENLLIQMCLSKFFD